MREYAGKEVWHYVVCVSDYQWDFVESLSHGLGSSGTMDLFQP